MATVDGPLLGTATLMVLIANYGLYRWLGGRILDDPSHKSALVCASLGLVLSTGMVLIAGPSNAAYAAGFIPWIMVSFFAYETSRVLAMGAGMGAWAVWWTVLAAGGWLASLAGAVAVD